MNLTKNLIGAGIFSLPSGLKSGSVIPGLSAMITATRIEDRVDRGVFCRWVQHSESNSLGGTRKNGTHPIHILYTSYTLTSLLLSKVATPQYPQCIDPRRTFLSTGQLKSRGHGVDVSESFYGSLGPKGRTMSNAQRLLWTPSSSFFRFWTNHPA